MAATLWVPAQMWTPPFGSESFRPPGFVTTSSTAASSVSIVNTAAPKFAASLIEDKALAP